MQTTEYLYELLVRGKPGGISGAHQIRAYEVRDDSGAVVHRGEGTATPLTIGGTEWASVIGQALNDALAENDALKAERDAAVTAMEAETQARATAEGQLAQAVETVGRLLQQREALMARVEALEKSGALA